MTFGNKKFSVFVTLLNLAALIYIYMHMDIEDTDYDYTKKVAERNFVSNVSERLAPTNDGLQIQPLSERVRVLCWIMTSPLNLDSRAQHVKDTWGKRCNVLLFMSSVKNDSFPTVGLNISEGRGHLTAKTMRAFRYVYENYYDKADWFLKADDDTYVIVENLRYFLSQQNSTEPIFFGHHFRAYMKQGYFSGGAGYCLSKEALRRYGENAKSAKPLCNQDGGDEDVEMGICMQNLGVKPGTSTDSLGRSRFHCFQPEKHIFGRYYPWYHRFDDFGGKKGKENINEYAISFHYVTPDMMHILDLFIYHIKPYGLFTNVTTET